MSHCLRYDSPIGEMIIEADNEKILSMGFTDDNVEYPELQFVKKPVSVLLKCKRELDLYFKGKLKVFTVDIAISGTPFREKVWKELLRIPYGETISYGELASRTGNVKSARAVGGANHNNKISIIVPCHRVIGANGGLTGYGGGLWRKEWLLGLEGSFPR